MTEADYDDLFRSTYPRLVALGLSMSAGRQVAQDLAQETMLRAHRHRERLGDVEAPAAWCLRVMTNLLIDHHRRDVVALRASERMRTQAAVPGDPRNSGTIDPADLATAPRWEELTRDLTSQQRLVATLYYAHDLPVDAIAATTQLSAGTIKSTLSKARHNLQRALGNTNGDENQ